MRPMGGWYYILYGCCMSDCDTVIASRIDVGLLFMHAKSRRGILGSDVLLPAACKLVQFWRRLLFTRLQSHCRVTHFPVIRVSNTLDLGQR
jgi:hypothetical protein